MPKIWRLLPHDRSAIESLARSLGAPPLVAQLLLNRQLGAPAAAKRFLAAPLTNLHEPELLPGVRAAVERLLDAVKQGKRICVYGDYDVDGVTGTCILLTALQLLGANVDYHVPHRLDEGYGLNVQALQKLAEEGVQVVVTVDCGIASIAEADEAKKLGLELLITDHHEAKETLPAAAVLVHPRVLGPYPFGGLSGAGVAFKVAWALCKRAAGSDKVAPPMREFLLDAVALAALGTVADVMPLQDENRVFVRHGLARLASHRSVGIQALLRSAGLAERSALEAMDIAFQLAPRLNAAGRLGSARLAVELLMTASPERADELTREIEELNQRRQQMERQMLAEARDLVEKNDMTAAPALVLAGARWHPGLLGIVAGRLSDLYGRPALMIALRDHEPLAVGSGRSVPGFKLHEALRACGEHLVTHGGHAAAAGFKLRPTAVVLLRERFCAVAGQQLGASPLAPRLSIDAEAPLASLTLQVVEALGQLEPYGAGNPQPLFLAGNLEVVGEPKRVGNDRHLSFRVRQQQRELRAIAFGMGDRAAELMSAGGRCCAVFTPRVNEWQGFRSVQLIVKDFQAGPNAQLE